MKSLLDLTPRDCRYPLEGEGGDTLFCAEVKASHSSYCERHAKLCCSIPRINAEDLIRKAA